MVKRTILYRYFTPDLALLVHPHERPEMDLDESVAAFDLALTKHIERHIPWAKVMIAHQAEEGPGFIGAPTEELEPALVELANDIAYQPQRWYRRQLRLRIA